MNKSIEDTKQKFETAFSPDKNGLNASLQDTKEKFNASLQDTKEKFEKTFTPELGDKIKDTLITVAETGLGIVGGILGGGGGVMPAGPSNTPIKSPKPTIPITHGNKNLFLYIAGGIVLLGAVFALKK